MVALGIIGLVIGIALVIFFAFKNLNLIIFAPICCLVMGLFNGMDLVEVVTVHYMDGFTFIITIFFLVFLLGGLLAKIYEVSGAALAITNAIYNGFTRKARLNAKHGEDIVLSPELAMLSIFAISVALTYGGLGVVVVTVVSAPIVVGIFRKSKMPNEMIPGTMLAAIAAGTPSLPGTASDQNILAGTLLGTDALSAAGIGIAGGVFILIINYVALTWWGKKNIAKKNFFDVNTTTDQSGDVADKKIPAWPVAIIPMVVIFVCYNAFKLHIVVSLTLGILVSIALFWNFIGGPKQLAKMLTPVAETTSITVLLMGSLTGLGAVVAAAPVFPVITEGLLSLPLPPMFTAAIAIMGVTAFASSGPSGITIALPNFKGMFDTLGISLQSLHRTAVFASQTLDTLPQNPVLQLVVKYGETNVAKSYKYIFVSTVLNTTLGTLLVAALFTALG